MAGRPLRRARMNGGLVYSVTAIIKTDPWEYIPGDEHRRSFEVDYFVRTDKGIDEAGKRATSVARKEFGARFIDILEPEVVKGHTGQVDYP